MHNINVLKTGKGVLVPSQQASGKKMLRDTSVLHADVADALTEVKQKRSAFPENWN